MAKRKRMWAARDTGMGAAWTQLYVRIEPVFDNGWFSGGWFAEIEGNPLRLRPGQCVEIEPIVLVRKAVRRAKK